MDGVASVETNFLSQIAYTKDQLVKISDLSKNDNRHEAATVATQLIDTLGPDHMSVLAECIEEENIPAMWFVIDVRRLNSLDIEGVSKMLSKPVFDNNQHLSFRTEIVQSISKATPVAASEKNIAISAINTLLPNILHNYKQSLESRNLAAQYVDLRDIVALWKLQLALVDRKSSQNLELLSESIDDDLELQHAKRALLEKSTKKMSINDPDEYLSQQFIDQRKDIAQETLAAEQQKMYLTLYPWLGTEDNSEYAGEYSGLSFPDIARTSEQLDFNKVKFAMRGLVEVGDNSGTFSFESSSGLAVSIEPIRSRRDSLLRRHRFQGFVDFLPMGRGSYIEGNMMFNVALAAVGMRDFITTMEAPNSKLPKVDMLSGVTNLRMAMAARILGFNITHNDAYENFLVSLKAQHSKGELSDDQFKIQRDNYLDQTRVEVQGDVKVIKKKLEDMAKSRTLEKLIKRADREIARKLSEKYQ